MNKNILRVFVLMLVSAASLLSQPWYEIKTPHEKNFLSDISYLGNGVIAVDDILGVWVTTDKGFTWNRTLNTYNVLKMQSTNSLYAIGGVGESFIYVSNRTGQTWNNIATAEISRPFVVRLAVRDSNEIFSLGTKFGGDQPLLFRTTNRGEQWNLVSATEPLYFLEIVTGPDSLLYGLHEQYGFYRSTNNGVSWSASIGGLTTTEFTSLRKNSEGFLFITSVEGKLFRSTDHGQSWHSRTSAFADSVTLSSLVCLSSNEMYVLAQSGLSYSVYRSFDGGSSWLQQRDVLEPYDSYHNCSMSVYTDGSIVILSNEKILTNDSTFNVTSVNDQSRRTQVNFTLTQNYPNPFNATTKILFSVHQKGFVRMRIFDPLGKMVTTLVERVLGEGEHEAIFDGTNRVSGMYFYQIQYEDRIETKRMVLIK